MAAVQPPICEFGKKAIDFKLKGVDGKEYALKDCAGERGTLVVFFSNHCPYVKAIRERFLKDVRALEKLGVKTVAIMSNDVVNYPEDSFENMRKVAREFDYPFPYLFDETQEVARAYGAVCTPDFFAYNANLELQYRGRLDEGRLEPPSEGARRELYEAMAMVAETGKGPEEQKASMGCSIKWK